MTAAGIPAPSPAPDEWLDTDETATLMRRSADYIRKRSRPSWRGPGAQLHGHHSSDGTHGGRWLHRRDVVQAAIQGADHPTQVRVCGCERLALAGATGRRSRAAP